MDDKTLVLTCANALVRQGLAPAHSRVVDRLASLHMHMKAGLNSRDSPPTDAVVGSDAAYLMHAAILLRDSPVYAGQLRRCAGGLTRGYISA